MTIKTKPPSDAYDAGWDRIFGAGRKPTYVDILADAMVQGFKGESRTIIVEDDVLNQVSEARTRALIESTRDISETQEKRMAFQIAFEAKVRGWERKMEDLLIDMMNDATPHGIPYCPNVMPLMNAFGQVVEIMRADHKRNAENPQYWLNLGPKEEPCSDS